MPLLTTTMLISVMPRCRFMHDILFGVDVIVKGLRGSTEVLEDSPPDSGTSGPRKAAAVGGAQAERQPLQCLLHVSNLTVLLPASSK